LSPGFAHAPHGREPSILGARITARGLDYLCDDGWLTAELGVVTIRIDTASIQALIEAKVAASTAPPEVKSKIRHRLASMTDEAWTALTRGLVERGLDSLPDAATLLRTVTGLPG